MERLPHERYLSLLLTPGKASVFSAGVTSGRTRDLRPSSRAHARPHHNEDETDEAVRIYAGWSGTPGNNGPVGPEVTQPPNFVMRWGAKTAP